ncbi:MAG: class I SAM-dependent methyltransferase [Pirellulaceae bacterium]
MIIKTALKLTEFSPSFRRFLWRRWYQYLAGYGVSDWRFMNYGYAQIEFEEAPLKLPPEDESDRYAIQLYHQVAGAIELRDRDVLEVGSGRGGGASFVKRRHLPRRMTGVDFSAKAVRFCRKQHRLEGLSFVHGDAEALPLGDETFDAVINVESSHCYGSMPAFLREVDRVLRPGGHFLFADLRAEADRDRLDAQLRETGMKIVEQRDVTQNVLEALRQDSERKQALIERSVNRHLIRLFRQFAAVEGSEVLEGFRSGAIVYLRYALRKPDACASP